jgi:hypothetical protein
MQKELYILFKSVYIHLNQQFNHGGQKRQQIRPRTNNFLSLVWNITKLPHRIELAIPKNPIVLLHFGGKMMCQLWRKKIKHELRTC